MNNTFKNLLIITIASFAILSCNSSTEQEDKSNEPKQESSSVTSPSKDAYNPGEDWQLSWSDEFDGDALNTDYWNYQVEPAGRFNEEWQRYTNSTENAYVDNSCLVIKAIHESDEHAMDQYTSARMNTANKYAFKYGKIAARIKLPEGQGIWPAFWMLGANINENGGDTPWPQTGEIDIFELYGSKDDGVIEANAHFADASGSHGMMGAAAYKLEQGKFSEAFHIFELEWNEKELIWMVDGQQYASMSIVEEHFSEFQKDFFILLNIAVGGTYAGRPDDSTKFPQYMFVDWVRVYEKAT